MGDYGTLDPVEKMGATMSALDQRMNGQDGFMEAIKMADGLVAQKQEKISKEHTAGFLQTVLGGGDPVEAFRRFPKTDQRQVQGFITQMMARKEQEQQAAAANAEWDRRRVAGNADEQAKTAATQAQDLEQKRLGAQTVGFLQRGIPQGPIPQPTGAGPTVAAAAAGEPTGSPPMAPVPPPGPPATDPGSGMFLDTLLANKAATPPPTAQPGMQTVKPVGGFLDLPEANQPYYGDAQKAIGEQEKTAAEIENKRVSTENIQRDNQRADAQFLANTDPVLQEALAKAKAQGKGAQVGALLANSNFTDAGRQLAAQRFLATGDMSSLRGEQVYVFNQAADVMARTGQTFSDVMKNQTVIRGERDAYKFMAKYDAQVKQLEGTANANADVVLSFADKFGGAPLQIMNRGIFAIRKQTGDPEATRYAAALNTFTNEYAKVMTGAVGSQAATDSARQEAADMLHAAMTSGQLTATVNLMKQDMSNRLWALANTRTDILDRILLSQGGEGNVPWDRAPEAPPQPRADGTMPPVGPRTEVKGGAQPAPKQGDVYDGVDPLTGAPDKRVYDGQKWVPQGGAAAPATDPAAEAEAYMKRLGL